jgi:hypothetical protein
MIAFGIGAYSSHIVIRDVLSAPAGQDLAHARQEPAVAGSDGESLRIAAEPA